MGRAKNIADCVYYVVRRLTGGIDYNIGEKEVRNYLSGDLEEVVNKFNLPESQEAIKAVYKSVENLDGFADEVHQKSQDNMKELRLLYAGSRAIKTLDSIGNMYVFSGYVVGGYIVNSMPLVMYYAFATAGVTLAKIVADSVYSLLFYNKSVKEKEKKVFFDYVGDVLSLGGLLTLPTKFVDIFRGNSYATSIKRFAIKKAIFDVAKNRGLIRQSPYDDPPHSAPPSSGEKKFGVIPNRDDSLGGKSQKRC